MKRKSAGTITNTFDPLAVDPLHLRSDRFFDPERQVRGIGRELYEEVTDLPLVCPHGHVDPRLLADDESFPESTSLIITPDHSPSTRSNLEPTVSENTRTRQVSIIK